MNIHESAENYLERILMVRERKGIVYSIDIAHELNFSKPSASVAMKRLRGNGYIQMDTDGAITLIPPGENTVELDRGIFLSEGKDRESAPCIGCFCHPGQKLRETCLDQSGDLVLQHRL